MRPRGNLLAGCASCSPGSEILEAHQIIMRHNTGWFSTPFTLTSFPETSCDPRSLPQPALLRPSPLRSSVCRPHPCHASWRWCSPQFPFAAQPEEAAAMLRPGGTARKELSSRCRSGCRTRKLIAPAPLPSKYKILSECRHRTI
jgi:hypothetical protein